MTTESNKDYEGPAYQGMVQRGGKKFMTDADPASVAGLGALLTAESLEADGEKYVELHQHGKWLVLSVAQVKGLAEWIKHEID